MFYSLFRVTIAHICFTARRAVFMHHYNGFSDSVQCMSLRNFETGLGKLILLNTSMLIKSLKPPKYQIYIYIYIYIH